MNVENVMDDVFTNTYTKFVSSINNSEEYNAQIKERDLRFVSYIKENFAKKLGIQDEYTELHTLFNIIDCFFSLKHQLCDELHLHKSVINNFSQYTERFQSIILDLLRLQSKVYYDAMLDDKIKAFVHGVSRELRFAWKDVRRMSDYKIDNNYPYFVVDHSLKHLELTQEKDHVLFKFLNVHVFYDETDGVWTMDIKPVRSEMNQNIELFNFFLPTSRTLIIDTLHRYLCRNDFSEAHYIGNYKLRPGVIGVCLLKTVFNIEQDVYIDYRLVHPWKK